MAAPVKRRINNPMMEDLDGVEPEVDSDDEDMGAAEMIEANKSEMTEDELAAPPPAPLLQIQTPSREPRQATSDTTSASVPQS